MESRKKFMKTIGRINNRKNWLRVILGSIIFLVCLELYLRYYWGFGDSVLMMESKNYEYIPQPNQDRFRFRNHVRYNSLSMRSPEVDTSAIIVLGFGDSVINGGVAVDQDSLATTLLTQDLSNALHQKVQVLNISAGSWGPDNCFAYLQEKGNFNAKAIFLVVSSHDAYDNMDFEKVIDKVRRYESRQYSSGIVELLVKYGIPRIMNTDTGDGVDILKKGKIFNPGFAAFANYCREQHLPFFIFLHPDKSELEQKHFNRQGEEIIKFCVNNNIQCFQGMADTEEGEYRGGIHLNDAGQRHLARILFPKILSQLDSNKNSF